MCFDSRFVTWLVLLVAATDAAFGKQFSFSVQHELQLWKNGKRSDICPAANYEFIKSTTFAEWRLSPSLLLSSGLPIDPERRNFVRKVRNAVFSFVDPTPLKTDVKLVALSDDVLNDILDLDPTNCKTLKKFIDFASGNKILKESTPIAHRYGGHQFGSWASQLGDGRAHLIGEYVNKKGERWELQLKGSGKTPYSRHGDGRAVLRSSVREFLCSEALHHLGIPTSRAATLAVSNDPVIRDQFYNGNMKTERAAVVLRLAPSWFRIGSLEILESENEIELLSHLVDFIIANYFDEIDSEASERYVDFYRAVFNRTISTVAKWMSVGFAHGVCNTDNFSLLGLTIDFGPFGFVEEYASDFVPNTSDDEGRYALERQASVAMYNLDKLRVAISPILTKAGREKVSKILDTFGDRYEAQINSEFRKKLGLFNDMQKDPLLIGSMLYLMEETRSDFTMTFRDLSELPIENFFVESIPESMWALQDLMSHKLFPKWLESYRMRLLENPDHVTDKLRMEKMQAVNPRYVLKNWMAEEAIRKAETDDFSGVRLLLKVLKTPFVKQEIAEIFGYSGKRPNWANKLKVSCSS